ncbi:hypothetical protein Goe21_00540 [Bacillus phage vB_BsuM-Goe21]|nr:hypothetical protein Goe21_00540 [Bacillus phage vB_BsuM-Goe21]
MNQTLENLKTPNGKNRLDFKARKHLVMWDTYSICALDRSIRGISNITDAPDIYRNYTQIEHIYHEIILSEEKIELICSNKNNINIYDIIDVFPAINTLNPANKPIIDYELVNQIKNKMYKYYNNEENSSKISREKYTKYREERLNNHDERIAVVGYKLLFKEKKVLLKSNFFIDGLCYSEDNIKRIDDDKLIISYDITQLMISEKNYI